MARLGFRVASFFCGDVAVDVVCDRVCFFDWVLLSFAAARARVRPGGGEQFGQRPAGPRRVRLPAAALGARPRSGRPAGPPGGALLQVTKPTRRTRTVQTRSNLTEPNRTRRCRWRPVRPISSRWCLAPSCRRSTFPSSSRRSPLPSNRFVFAEFFYRVVAELLPSFPRPVPVPRSKSRKRFAWWRRNVGTESRGAHWFHMMSLLFVSQSELRKAPPSRCVLPRRPDPLTGRKRRHASLSANEGSWNPCFFFFVSSAAMDGTGFTETAPILGRTAFETCHRLLSIVFFLFFLERGRRIAAGRHRVAVPGHVESDRSGAVAQPLRAEPALVAQLALGGVAAAGKIDLKFARGTIFSTFW